jgi:hypothetical protein
LFSFEGRIDRAVYRIGGGVTIAYTHDPGERIHELRGT